MCLAIPGKIQSISEEDPVNRKGRVDFGGVLRDVCLAYTPEANVGDYVMVHVGFALSVVDEAEAREVFDFLKLACELEDLEEQGLAEPGPEPARQGE